MTLGINTECHYTECQYAEGRVLFIVNHNVIMLSVVMVNAVMLSVVASTNSTATLKKHFLFIKTKDLLQIDLRVIKN